MVWKHMLGQQCWSYNDVTLKPSGNLSVFNNLDENKLHFLNRQNSREQMQKLILAKGDRAFQQTKILSANNINLLSAYMTYSIHNNFSPHCAYMMY